MTRKKVKLAFITNDSSRKATFKKRKKGLMKKVSELSTLCGIDACTIVYSPYEQQPDVWPDTRGAHHVVAQFKRMPEMEQSKKMVNQESFIRNRIAKAAEQLKKIHKDNREKEMTHLMYACLTGKGVTGLAMPELNDVGWLIDRDLKEIYKRIETLKKGVPPAKVVEKATEVGGGQQQSWFGDWAGNIPTEIHQHGQMSGGTFALGGEDMISQFNDGNPHNVVNHNHGANILWSSAFFS